MELVWEIIDSFHQRAKVPGGWLVKAYEDVVQDRSESGQGLIPGWDFRISMCFVPDPYHDWK